MAYADASHRTRTRYDDEKVRNIVLDVARHYQSAACCIALEFGGEMHLKARYGVTQRTAPFSSLTRHISGRSLPIIISDAANEERVRNDPLVKGAPFTRSYVGAPLMNSSMQCVGTLCIMGTDARDYSLEECQHLMDAAVQVSQHAEEMMAAMAMPSSLTYGTLPALDCRLGLKVSNLADLEEDQEEGLSEPSEYNSERVSESNHPG